MYSYKCTIHFAHNLLTPCHTMTTFNDHEKEGFKKTWRKKKCSRPEMSPLTECMTTFMF